MVLIGVNDEGVVAMRAAGGFQNPLAPSFGFGGNVVVQGNGICHIYNGSSSLDQDSLSRPLNDDGQETLVGTPLGVQSQYQRFRQC
jgi:hypothetical protein